MFGQSDPYHIRQLFTVDARYVGVKGNIKMKLILENFKKFINEEEDAMRGADRPGAGIEDIAQPEGEEPIDVLMDVKARLAGMSEEELMQLAADLDGDMVTALRHILSDKMYMQEARAVTRGTLAHLVGKDATTVATVEEIAGELFEQLDRIDDPRERKQIISILIVNLQMEYDNILTSPRVAK